MPGFDYVKMRKLNLFLGSFLFLVFLFIAPAFFTVYDCRPRPALESKWRMQKLAQAIILFSIDTGQLPPGLGSLVKKKGTKMDGWDGPYVLDQQLNDTWGNSFLYKFSGSSFTVSSLGEDKIPNSSDDLFIQGQKARLKDEVVSNPSDGNIENPLLD